MWRKYGTCSGMNSQEYLASTSILHLKTTLPPAHVMETGHVSRSRLIKALEGDVTDSVVLGCVGKRLLCYTCTPAMNVQKAVYLGNESRVPKSTTGNRLASNKIFNCGAFRRNQETLLRLGNVTIYCNHTQAMLTAIKLFYYR